MTFKTPRDLPVLAIAALLLPAVAHAYIDPGFGVLVLQTLFGAFLGAIFLFRSTIAASARWVKHKISGAPPVPPKSPSERPTEQG